MLKCSPTTNYCAIEITGENGRTEPTIILFIKYKKKQYYHLKHKIYNKTFYETHTNVLRTASNNKTTVKKENHLCRHYLVQRRLNPDGAPV